MQYKVKLNYGPEYIFDSIEEAGSFFDQALRHATEPLKWTNIEPVYPESEDAEEVTDD